MPQVNVAKERLVEHLGRFFGQPVMFGEDLKHVVVQGQQVLRKALVLILNLPFEWLEVFFVIQKWPGLLLTYFLPRSVAGSREFDSEFTASSNTSDGAKHGGVEMLNLLPDEIESLLESEFPNGKAIRQEGPKHNGQKRTERGNGDLAQIHQFGHKFGLIGTQVLDYVGHAVSLLPVEQDVWFRSS